MKETLDELELRHRQELKELQGRIQGIKKSVPKGDKKAKKRSTEDIAKLQQETDERHRNELESLKLRLTSVSIDDEHVAEDNTSPITAPEPQRKSRAEKRREAKAAAEHQKLAEIDEAVTCPPENSLKSKEHLKILNTLRADDLTVFDIPADGNCMFYALQHQLKPRGHDLTVPELRATAVDHMIAHREEFLPFLVDMVTGDIMSEEQFERYCSDMRGNGVWGGMHEAHAISTALGIPIRIVQANVPAITFGDGLEQPPIVLLYYKHKYGLGEHYDSVTSLSEKEGEEVS